MAHRDSWRDARLIAASHATTQGLGHMPVDSGDLPARAPDSPEPPRLPGGWAVGPDPAEPAVQDIVLGLLILRRWRCGQPEGSTVTGNYIAGGAGG